MAIVDPPPKIDSSINNDCYVKATAAFLGLSYAKAFEVFFRDRPDRVGEFDAALHVDDFERVMARFGVVRREVKNHERLKRPALLICAWAPDRECDTLHATVWDPIQKKRVDPNGHDTLKHFRGTVIRTFVKERAASDAA